MLPNRTRKRTSSVFHADEESFVLIELGMDLGFSEQGILEDSEVLVCVAQRVASTAEHDQHGPQDTKFKHLVDSTVDLSHQAARRGYFTFLVNTDQQAEALHSRISQRSSETANNMKH